MGAWVRFSWIVVEEGWALVLVGGCFFPFEVYLLGFCYLCYAVHVQGVV